MKKYINKKTVGGAILAVLLLLIFFSKTIYGFYLPEVTAAKPSNGRLSKRETASGLVECAETVNVYAALTGWVDEALVAVGDTVAEGDPLFRLRFDRDEAERKLRELAVSRTKLDGDLLGTQMSLQNVGFAVEKLELSIETLRLRIAKTERYRDELTDEVYDADEVSTYELDALQLDLKKAEEDLAQTQLLFSLDEVSAQEVTRAESALAALKLRRDNLTRTMAEQAEKNRKALEDKEKTRTRQLLDYESDLAGYALDLRGLEIDLELKTAEQQQRALDLRAKEIEVENLALQEELYQSALRDYDANLVVTAPAAGVITAVTPAAGEFVAENRLLASVGVSDAFIIKCTVPQDNNFILAGDACKLSNATHTFDGVVLKVEPEAQGKVVTVALDRYSGAIGETFEVTFQKESTTTYTLVPNGAVNQDNTGYYLNQIKRRDGMLGKEYYLERLDVYVGDSDDTNTVILQGVIFFEPIAVLSDKPISPDNTVRLKNAGDFFEN